MVLCQNLSCEVYSYFLFERAARGSRIFSNISNILTEVMHLYSIIQAWTATGEFVVMSDVL